MKKTLIIAASLFLAAGASKVNAQLANYTVTAPNLTENRTNADNKSASVAGVSSNVTDNFSKTFPGVANVIWSKADNATWGYFKQQSVPVRVCYNGKGKLLYTISYLSGSQVSSGIKKMVTNEGYSMPIVHVTEIKSRYNTVNLVMMEDESSIVTLKVLANGDVSLYEEVKKG